MRRGAVLHAWAADDRYRAGLRSHHLGDRRRDDRLVWLRHALLCDAEGTSWPAGSRRREGGSDHLSHRQARWGPRQGAPGGANPRRCGLPRKIRFPLAGSVQSRSRSRYSAAVSRRNAAERGAKNRAFLLDVRAAVLLDEDHARSSRRSFSDGRARQRHGGKERRVFGERRQALRVRGRAAQTVHRFKKAKGGPRAAASHRAAPAPLRRKQFSIGLLHRQSPRISRLNFGAKILIFAPRGVGYARATARADETGRRVQTSSQISRRVRSGAMITTREGPELINLRRFLRQQRDHTN